MIQPLDTLRDPKLPSAAAGVVSDRVLLVLGSGETSTVALHFAVLLTAALGGELLLLQVTPDDEATAEDSQPSLPDALLAGGSYRILERQEEDVAEAVLAAAREERCDLIILSWQQGIPGLHTRRGHIFGPIVDEAPCDVAVVQGAVAGGEAGPPRRMLLPIAGGPHASRAARWALGLARAHGGDVTLLTVLPLNADKVAEKDAYAFLDRIVAESGLGAVASDQFVERRVLRAARAVPTLLELAPAYDLVWLGATRTSMLSQLVLGSVVERLSSQLQKPIVIVKHPTGRRQRWLHLGWRTLNHLLPTVSDQDRLDVYKRVRRGARATADFFTLMLLSVIIATMGLLLNSGAVIIGAMLVAPLMTPILALGLGVVMGDGRLLKLGLLSTMKGILLAVAVSALLAWLAPLTLFTTEIESRTHPNLLDLTVALAAGMAGAYSVSRPRVAAALPGVAIAAALVPPLSVIGICLATSRWAAAGGAALLFGTNLVAISLAAAMVYLLFGFVPQEAERRRQVVLRRGMGVSLLLLFLVTVPLASRLERDVNDTVLNRTLRGALEEVLTTESQLALFNFEWSAPPKQPLQVRVVVLAEENPTPETYQGIQQGLSAALGREVELRLVIIPVSELRDPTAPP